ncbi:N-alpha-acetyltransferase 30 isoform X2 [Boleophthalmus pectinirostris]|uniref:N-alpha-acetyltransferase 30 isoform X2 n=1 Tax=Boleophthalmus pectinirostris TaxID=150288 RepID=UPI002431820B|nr:N-alpha-acetyltransferase 30 isoform X2 [Boleophthalmus pectinirostris]
MATVPPGPSSAVPSSPAQAAPFPGAGDSELGRGDGEPACHLSDCVPDTGNRPLSVTDVKKTAKKKQKNMLARASPALHLPMQSREQQLNGLASPTEHGDDPHTDNRPDNPRTIADNGDSGSPEPYTGIRNSSEHCQHEGHSPLSKNGSQSPLVNNSMNGIPAFTRTEESPSQPLEEQAQASEHPQSPGPLRDSAGTAAEEPPAAELARLHLSSPVPTEPEDHGIRYVRYESELQMPWIMRLITKDLSEPYSIYTYRYFIHNWPQLCFLAMVEQECVGAIVCKLDMHKKMFRRGYIAMLAVDSKHRRKSIGTNLVKKAIYAMVEGDCDECGAADTSCVPQQTSQLFLSYCTSVCAVSVEVPKCGNK